MNSRTPSVAASGRSSLIRLFAIRGVLAVIWALVFASAHQTLGAIAVILLVSYPLIDAVSSVVDHAATADPSARRVTAVNGIVSALAAVAVGIAGVTGGVPAVLGVFGGWAVVSGAAQLVVGLRRRSAASGRQWPTLISGGLSVLVGAFYIVQATGADPSLDVLSVYATGGGVFFLLQALLLVVESRRQRTVAAVSEADRTLDQQHAAG
ncbi:DUF308 domain-containing protein [Nocardia spumae]|uniref:DUF308 domain-containing protein n=1 Tax=Nocardia spumae TaxID=2887190 RepID=UPI001D142668|nr:DUF308 domain-containing protein [Nocardia spumae]